MRSLKILLLVVPSLVSGTAHAADLHGAAFDRRIAETWPALRQFYLRADLGSARPAVGAFSQMDLTDNGGAFVSKSVDDTVMIGAGLGWQVTDRIRFDITAEYRSSAQVTALDNLSATLTNPDGSLIANTHYQGRMSAIVGLLNGYLDLGTQRGITPYVGAGIGLSRTSTAGFTTASSSTFVDATTGEAATQLTHGIGGGKSQLNFAWALMAGFNVDISTHAKLDLGYRYLNLGADIAATTGVFDCVCGVVAQPLKMGDLEAHEFRIGLRIPLSRSAEPMHHRPMK
jgi:opacity protein-like surface antigen